jgi:hypothetical protein
MDKLVTIIGSAYFEPISILLERLEKYDQDNASEVQSGHFVNGFSSSICLLAVVCLESYVMRVRYINNASGADLNKRSVPAYLLNVYQDFPYENEIYEIFILRDIIAHNHLWEVSFSWDEDINMALDSIVKLSFGDTKYKQHVDVSNNKTRKLGLNINPIRIDATDSKKVLQAMWRILIFLEGKNRSQCYVSHLYVKHKGQHVRFGEVIGLGETCT